MTLKKSLKKKKKKKMTTITLTAATAYLLIVKPKFDQQQKTSKQINQKIKCNKTNNQTQTTKKQKNNIDDKCNKQMKKTAATPYMFVFLLKVKPKFEQQQKTTKEINQKKIKFHKTIKCNKTKNHNKQINNISAKSNKQMKKTAATPYTGWFFLTGPPQFQYQKENYHILE